MASNSKTLAEVAVVENCFGSSGQPLLDVSGRVLLKEGVLTKICRKEAKPRIFFLFNDILVYGSIVTPKKEYIKQRIIPVEKVEFKGLEDTGNEKYRWIIKTSTKSFVVYSDTLEEKWDWMAKFKQCLSDLKKRGENAAEQHAAVWVPDSAAPECQVCGNKFTFVTRRHHCRKCGCVVCGQCSKHRALLPNQRNKPVRVCNKCNPNPASSFVNDLVKL